jgi:hypothetical protein
LSGKRRANCWRGARFNVGLVARHPKLGGGRLSVPKPTGRKRPSAALRCDDKSGGNAAAADIRGPVREFVVAPRSRSSGRSYRLVDETTVSRSEAEVTHRTWQMGTTARLSLKPAVTLPIGE